MDWLNYHHLLNFWLVAREGSVQRASELLHVTPASVSVQIKQLERALKVQLLKKQGRGLVLTEMGEQVAEYASEIFATGRELMELVSGSPVGRPLALRVGIRDVMPKLVAFQLLQPAFHIDQSIRLDRLGRSDVVIVGTKELAKKYRDRFPESLNGAPFLLPMDNCILRRAMDQWFSERHLIPCIKGEFADSAMLKIAGRQGLGLFALPKSIQEDVTSIYGLHEVGLAVGVQEQFYAVSIGKKLKDPAVIAILEHAK